MILQTFWALVSDRLPPNTVKSCENNITGRPSIVADPVTMPSPRITWSPMSKS
jgi:hypothetical protein